ncbi:MAG: histidine phosphatase family protein [Acidobacteria bacterium]|nr:histidine phosphatase family protein [Acidobacteriota bacterium]
MRLILIRHGQTQSNVQNLLDTVEPGPDLTTLGARQAAAVVEPLRDEVLDAIYASSQPRAQQTAAPLAAARQRDVDIQRGLREIHAGHLEGLGGEEAIRKYLLVVREWLLGDLAVQMPGGETGADVLGRFDQVVRQAEESGQQNVVMFSHGAMIRTWSACRVTNLDPTRPELYGLSNTGMVLLEGSMNQLRDGENGRGFHCIRWQTDALGGAALDDLAADGPTANTRDDS